MMFCPRRKFLPCLCLLVLIAAGGCQKPQSTADNTKPDDKKSTKQVSQKKSPTATSTAPPLAPEPQLLPAAALAEGWISLFDGGSLFGWQAHSQADWRVEDGTIVVGKGSQGLLCTTSTYGDYVLKLEFKSDQGTNSGIFLRTPPQPSDPAKDCYELNIADSDNPFPTGSLVGRAKAKGNFDSADWQAYEITVLGSQITVALDGKQVLQYQDPTPPAAGHIGLQLNKGRVAFRNIQLRPLGTKPLFDGKTLEGWTTYPEMKSTFQVTPEGWLNVKNGPGQLETKEKYANFLLQLECNTHAPHLNSGIFFRCIPGQRMMGYECQIQNQMKGDDPKQPFDCGTGGFFRRSDARRIVARDQQWFHLTLSVNGPHMAAWVNGYQVSDWTDTRTAHENPRKGLRTDLGTIMIQGHDPTTDISFRKLRLAQP